VTKRAGNVGNITASDRTDTQKMKEHRQACLKLVADAAFPAKGKDGLTKEW